MHRAGAGRPRRTEAAVGNPTAADQHLERTLYANADDDAEYSAFPDDVSAFDRAETTPAEDDENPF